MKASPLPDVNRSFRRDLFLPATLLLILCFCIFSAQAGAAEEIPRTAEVVICSTAVKPTITLNGPATICAGGSVLLTASSGKSYKWNNGATSQSITVTQSGEYVVEVTDENGCVGKSDTLVVEVAGRLERPKIEFTDPLVVCGKGSLKMSVPLQEGASYVWKKDGVPVSDKSNEYTATETGVYTVELSNFCGYVKSANKVEFEIQKPIPAFDVEAAGKLVFCKGGSVKLSVPEYKNVTYAWFRDGKKISGSNQELVAEEAGTYTAEITSACGTFRSSKGQQVELLALPEPPKVEEAVGCTKSSLTLKASGGRPGMYRWYTAAKGGVAIAGAHEASFTTPMLSTTTTYFVAITNGQCESERVPVEAIINTKPDVTAIEAKGPLEFCEGGSVELSAAAYKGFNYTWLRDGKEYASGSNALHVTESGVYTLKLHNECGATLSSNSIKVKVWPAPDAPVATDGSSCGPGKVTLSATGGTAGEYRWYKDAASATPIANATSATFETPELKDSRTYYVTLVRNGCETERVPVQAYVYPVPMAVANVEDYEIDAGESTSLVGSGGVSFSWSPSAGLDDPNSANPVATPVQTTRYTLTVRNEEGCEDTVSVVVNVRQLLEIPNAFSPNGDGINDTWEIKNIEYFPDAKLEVYNRWGSLIFEQINYRSDWGGTYRGAALPVSTYFYVITVPGKGKFTGYLNIVN
ncbi:gliding motility-associated C-terminal domain-containing protein [Pontibacter anaerobius]|uniref:Gliding motility-associated C-terminal domain-containing protein n=1 Tax=Pontibacter anaerobius TaxID=2993940 RepID=A0ABT3RAL5_9BACT|nr:gliding motility-associated C-terminal domain-containing protein [Pontibacter anaerobius]MCX2738908.1 gliding motility-associated C-terminal domain-containing protein [Pontibacter anaerobius]